jgi:hypothetical protein
MLGLIVTLAMSVLALMWLLFLVKRRRPDAEPVPAVAAEASSGTLALGPPPTSLFAGAAPVVPVVTSPPVTPVVDPAEADMPRWRRPSVKAGRFGTGLAGGSSRGPSRLFIGPPPVDVQRFGVRYDAVALLSEPDEVRGLVLDELDAGDEVELIGQSSAWLQVRTPHRRSGWIQRMTVEPLVPWDVRRGVVPDTGDGTAPTVAAEADASPLDSLLAAIVARRQEDAERAQAAAALAAHVAQEHGEAERQAERPALEARPRTKRPPRRRAPTLDAALAPEEPAG